MVHKYRDQDLQDFCQKVFEYLGLPREDSILAAEALIRANLEGVDSHGISRLKVYSKRIVEERIRAIPQITFQYPSDSIVLVDGDKGLGQVVAARAISEGIKIAKKTGVAIVSIKNSNHLGAASFYCEKACQEGIISLVFTNSPPGIPPHGGKKAFFGTNPIAIGIPTGTKIPILIDMSTSVTSRGKIILAAKEKRSIPEGWALNQAGFPTKNAEEALQGALLPTGGVKGYLLALAVEIFSGILTGAAFGPHVQSLFEENHGPANVGHFFILLDIRPFLEPTLFYTLVQQLLNEMKSVPLAEGFSEILYPGERRNREYEKRKREGIPLSNPIVSELYELSKQFAVPFVSEV